MESRFVSINNVIDSLFDNPLLKNLSFEAILRYTVRFINIVGIPQAYEDKYFHLITPRWGLVRMCLLRHRALPCANDIALSELFTIIIIFQPRLGNALRTGCAISLSPDRPVRSGAGK
jgi:hypothetical protein